MRIDFPKRNKLFVETIIYGLANAIYSGLPLILLPFMVVVLEPKDYGLVDLFRSISMVMVPLLGLSAVQSIGRFYFDLEEVTFKKFVSSIQIFQFFTSTIAIVILLISSCWIEKEYFILLLLSVVFFFSNQHIESLLVVYRVENKAVSFLFIRVLNIVLELSILYVLYLSFTQLDWQFRVYPTVIASLTVAVVVFLKFRKLGYRLTFSLKLLKVALIYSTPLILHMLSGYVLNIGDRFFIKLYLTEEDLGNYAVAYQIGMAINFFYTSFNLAWTPTYFRWMKEGRVTQIKKVKKIIHVLLPILGILVLLCWFTFKELFLANSRYNVSNHIVIVILIANTIFSFYKFDANFYLYNKNTQKLSKLSLLSALISIASNLVLIPKYGIIGAAYSTLAAFIILYLLVNLNKRNV